MPSPIPPKPVEPEIETAHVGEFVEQLRRMTDVLPERINTNAESFASRHQAVHRRTSGGRDSTPHLAS